MIVYQVMKAEKQKLRQKLRKKLQTQSENERLRNSRVIQSRLFALSEFKKAESVMFYLPINGEVDTWEMLKEAESEGKRVFVPVVLTAQEMIATELSDVSVNLISGPYGTLQPEPGDIRAVSPEDIDLVLVPGIGFDQQGNRLGRGKGYYDRFLNALPGTCVLIGLAFRFQVVKRLPVDSHDIRMHHVITN
jgi:5-formyltetrahydrofolate cyclo-ligase